MDWLDSKYAQERRDEQVRVAQHDAEIAKLLAEAQPKRKPNHVRRALGSKLVALGERLQAQTNSSNPVSSEIQLEY